MRPSVRIVIVNYRTGPLSVDCLRSLAPEIAAYPEARVTVVDNASGDGSAATIASAIATAGWTWAELVESPVNGGFAHGCNAGMRPALTGDSPPDLFWLLNPDTEVRPGALAALADFMVAHPKAGIAGSALLLADGSPWPYAFNFPSALGELEHGLQLSIATKLLARRASKVRMGERPARVDWVSGASMVVRRAVVEQIGLMDDGYFLYFEETDFQLAAHRAGWECWYVPDAVVRHIAGASTGVTGEAAGKRRIPGYLWQSRRRYFTKNHGPAYAAAADAAWLVAHGVSRLRRLAGRPVDPQPPKLVSDFVRHSTLFGGRTAA